MGGKHQFIPAAKHLNFYSASLRFNQSQIMNNKGSVGIEASQQECIHECGILTVGVSDDVLKLLNLPGCRIH